MLPGKKEKSPIMKGLDAVTGAVKLIGVLMWSAYQYLQLIDLLQ